MRKCIIAIVVFGLCATTQADDVLAPSWRDLPRTITAEWDNWGDGSSSMRVLNAEQVDADPPLTHLIAGYASWSSSSVGVLDSVGERQSVLEVNHPAGLTPVSFHLRNYSDGPEKLIRIQITYLGPGVLDFYIAGGPDIPDDDPQLWPTPDFGKVDAIATDAYQHDDGWTTTAYDFIIQPNPSWEVIALDWGTVPMLPTFIDQVVIDTICPEPTSLALLALGTTALLRKRR